MRLSGFLLFTCLALSLGAASAHGDTLVKQLLSAYDGIETLSCQIRKITDSPNEKVRMLSRVYYEKPDKIHVENVVPSLDQNKRRIICDGANFYSYIEGSDEGFTSPVDDLDPKMLIELRRIPGTPMDHLLRLESLEEIDLEPNPSHPVRKGYRGGPVFGVIALDDKGLISQIEYYRSEDMSVQTARYEYSHYTEVGDGIMIPLLHKGYLMESGLEFEETSRISNLAVNEPIPQHFFQHETFFAGVTFVTQ